MLSFDFGFAYLADRAYDSGALAPEGFAQQALPLVFLAINILVPILLIYYRHKRRDRWINEEAERWLENRSAQRTKPNKAWPRRVFRGLLWLPSVLALLVFFFEPEAMGIASHLFVGRTVSLNNHRLRTPLTSYVERSNNLSLSVWIGRGIGRVGPVPYWRREQPLSHLYFDTYRIPGDQLRRLTLDETILSERKLVFGDQTLTCFDIDSKRVGKGSDDAWIICLGNFRASFSGPRSDAALFYEILESATHQ